MTSERSEAVRVGLVATVRTRGPSQVTASNTRVLAAVLAPASGSTLVLPGAALAYALTFFASDCYAELYGRRAATVVVNVGFAMNFVLLALVWSTIFAPGLPQADSRSTSQPSGTSSGPARHRRRQPVAYLVSHNWDCSSSTGSSPTSARSSGSGTSARRHQPAYRYGHLHRRRLRPVSGRPAERGAGTHRRPVPAKSRYRRSRHAVRLRCRRLCSAKQRRYDLGERRMKEWSGLFDRFDERSGVSRHRFGPRPFRRPRRR